MHFQHCQMQCQLHASGNQLDMMCTSVKVMASLPARLTAAVNASPPFWTNADSAVVLLSCVFGVQVSSIQASRVIVVNAVLAHCVEADKSGV